MRQNIRDLKDKEAVDSHFFVREKYIGFGKNGRPYMSLQLSDQSGSLDARLWEKVEELSSEFEVGDVIAVKGQLQIFQNKKQIVIHKLHRKDPSEYNVEDYFAKSNKDPHELYAELIVLVKAMRNDHLRQLVMDSLEDPEIKSRLIQAPAAKTIHHAWKGGLLEHILSISKILQFFAKHYSFLNGDLLLFGAIFHDLGKIWELSWENGIQYTDKGRLLGHMLLSCELVEKKAGRILGFPEDLKDILKHIILSHHGKLEYGSPKAPHFLEAMLVAMVDDLDSKMDTVNSIVQGERTHGDKWSRYHEMFDRYFLLENLNEKY